MSAKGSAVFGTSPDEQPMGPVSAPGDGETAHSEELEPDAHSLAVPLTAVTARGRRRGFLAGLALCGVLAASVGLALLANQPASNGPRGSLAPALPSSASGASPSSAPAESAVAQRLPDVRSVPLEGAPEVGFMRREGNDLVVLAWRADGQGLTTIERLPGAYDGIGVADPDGSISHDGRAAILRTINTDAGEHPPLVRIVSRDGVIWERHGEVSPTSPIWSGDMNRVVVPVNNRAWLVVDVETTTPIVHRIDIKGMVPPGPPADLEFVLRPLAFSADDRWVYGEAAATVDPSNRRLFRAKAAGGRAVRLDALPTRGPSRAISDLYDPATGRTVDPTGFPNGNMSSLVVRNPDGSKAWEARFPVIFGTAWLGDGRVVVMYGNTLESPRYLTLAAISRRGTESQSMLLEAGPVAAGGILGVRDGHVLAVYAVDSPSQELLLVMIEPDDTRISTLRMNAYHLDRLRLGGWLDR